jgi:L-glutamine-phosphate cytidylyltransferase
MKIVILAAGIGSRLGNPFPKPLTPLKDGQTIMERQIGNLKSRFNQNDIAIVVGFKKDLIMEAFPNQLFIYNPVFDQTNTSKSLLRALIKFRNESVLWLNGDVVFEVNLIDKLLPLIQNETSFVAVNNSEVGEEEVKYSVDGEGFIHEISKSVSPAVGEAVGINFISSKDIQLLISHLEKCGDNDYFERGIETAIENENLKILPLDISEFNCLEVDFLEDLNRANKIMGNN